MDRAARFGSVQRPTLRAPVVDADGQPLRRTGGRIVRSRTERVPNTAGIRKARALLPEQLATLVGDDMTRGRANQRLIPFFERLEADGLMTLVRADRHRFRIMGPE